MRLLFVCTGNMCRSPIAERLAAAWAEDQLGASAATLWLDSAGTDAQDGRSMDERSAQALGEVGGDATAFRSRLLQRGEAERFDLVLTMSRRHRHKVLKHAPRALRRTFTLPEAAALLTIADVSDLPGLPMTDRAVELAVRLNAARPGRRSVEADDVPDPIGRPLSHHRQVANQIADDLQPIMKLLLAAPLARVSPVRSVGQVPPLRPQPSAPAALRRPPVPGQAQRTLAAGA